MYLYLDNAATTRMLPQVQEAMMPFLCREYYNPSADYSLSGKVRQKITQCREIIAEIINAGADEIYFTSGGTEADNWACMEGIRKRGHIISTKIEHKAVLNPLKKYKNERGLVDYVRLNSDGTMDVEEFERKIRNNTRFVSVMMANNEIGTILPVEEIGGICRDYDILFHSDGVQAFGHIPVDVKKCGMDYFSASGHKFNGPKGIGFLYAKKSTGIRPMIIGGGQENHMRAGTENVAGIVGMTMAAKLSAERLKQNAEYERKICSYMTGRIMKEIDRVIINGPKDLKKRLPNNMNFGFEGVDATSLLVLLDMEGICASAGSACNAKTQDASHVLQAVGTDEKYLRGSIRLSIDFTLSYKQADYVVDILKKSIYNIRQKEESIRG